MTPSIGTLLLAPSLPDHMELPGAACLAIQDFQKRRQGNTWSGPVGPAKDSSGRVMRINSCLSLVMQLGDKILNALRQDIYLPHNELPLAKASIVQAGGRPVSQSQEPLRRATNSHSITIWGAPLPSSSQSLQSPFTELLLCARSTLRD